MVTDFVHEPVLMEEVLTALQPVAGGLYVDGTVGGGGHAHAILEACSPDGCLVAFDRDDWALKASARRLAQYGSRLELYHEAFSGIAKKNEKSKMRRSFIGSGCEFTPTG